eukprot:15337937-Ditylum_brightwellii.AAC.1
MSPSGTVSLMDGASDSILSSIGVVYSIESVVISLKSDTDVGGENRSCPDGDSCSDGRSYLGGTGGRGFPLLP